MGCASKLSDLGEKKEKKDNKQVAGTNNESQEAGRNKSGLLSLLLYCNVVCSLNQKSNISGWMKQTSGPKRMHDLGE